MATVLGAGGFNVGNGSMVTFEKRISAKAMKFGYQVIVLIEYWYVLHRFVQLVSSPIRVVPN